MFSDRFVIVMSCGSIMMPVECDNRLFDFKFGSNMKPLTSFDLQNW